MNIPYAHNCLTLTCYLHIAFHIRLLHALSSYTLKNPFFNSHGELRMLGFHIFAEDERYSSHAES